MLFQQQVKNLIFFFLVLMSSSSSVDYYKGYCLSVTMVLLSLSIFLQLFCFRRWSQWPRSHAATAFCQESIYFYQFIPNSQDQRKAIKALFRPSKLVSSITIQQGHDFKSTCSVLYILITRNWVDFLSFCVLCEEIGRLPINHRLPQ